MKVLVVLAACLAVAAAGVVSPVERCGGAGVPLQLRVDDCTTPPCQVHPGRSYNVEGDFIPSAAYPVCAMKMSLMVTGVEFVILEVDVPNSAVNPGQMYTLRYPLVPDGILAGQTLDLTLQILGGGLTGALEICVKAPVHIVRPALF